MPSLTVKLFASVIAFAFVASAAAQAETARKNNNAQE